LRRSSKHAFAHIAYEIAYQHRPGIHIAIGSGFP
jgi:hypothetical protein